MPMVTLTIDGKQVQAEPGTTILDAAKLVNIKIPTLCYLKDINAIGACRICVVEVQGARTLQASCVASVEDNMVVYTNSPVVRASRRTTLELVLSDHPFVCASCVRNQKCELQDLAEELDISMYYSVYTNPDFPFKGAIFGSGNPIAPVDPVADSSKSFIRLDAAKCVQCRRCVAACPTAATTIR
jgi:NADH dehydrogenase/NADH:ubiquinone oxidoreductase subunit G